MGTRTGPAGQLLIGGSKGRTGAKAALTAVRYVSIQPPPALPLRADSEGGVEGGA